MGASTRQLVLRVLLPESLPGLIAGASVTSIALICVSRPNRNVRLLSLIEMSG